MDISTLLADPAAIQIQYFASEPDSITLVVKSVQSQPCCPKCGQPSSSLHSNYQRTVADLPWHGVAIKLQLHTRKFRCKNTLCPQKVFCERLPKVVAAYARKTVRLNSVLTLLAFALGGQAGSRTSSALSLTVSGDTLLRRIRQAPSPQFTDPKVLGVDDWAKRKGQNYGTILVDLERHSPIDLLPDREAETLAAWLKEHPSVEVIARDRSGAYADGARLGAPNAVQVADRWHLMKNITEAVERVVQNRNSCLRDAAGVVRQLQACSASAMIASTPTTMLSSHNGQSSQKSRQQRHNRYCEVMKLRKQGRSVLSIARRLKMSRMTVYKYIGADCFPERAQSRPRGSKLDEYLSYIHRRFAEGCDNATQIWREVVTRGYKGKEAMVRRYVRRLRTRVNGLSSTEEIKAGRIETAFPVPSARRAAWWLIKDEKELKEEEKEFVAQLTRLSPEIEQAKVMAESFRKMVVERDEKALESWIGEAGASGIKEIVGFAEGLTRDKEAVAGGLRLAWSNGQTEGQINRLKMLKRQMYGRANFDLLRARVLHKV
jgi:transposase